MLSMFWVETTEGGVDRDGELSARGLGQAPEQGDREDLFFSGREAVFGEGLVFSS